MDTPPLAPGTPTQGRITKWGGHRHWEWDGIYLGADEHGTWMGVPAGTPHARPGAAFDSDVDYVLLVPHADHPDGGRWLASLYAVGIWAQTYVDVTDRPRWDGTVLRAVDLDLDVIRRSADGSVYLDDEGEFAEHQVAYGYPADVVAAAEATAAWLMEAVTARRAPFDDAVVSGWLARLRELLPVVGDGGVVD